MCGVSIALDVIDSCGQVNEINFVDGDGAALAKMAPLLPWLGRSKLRLDPVGTVFGTAALA